MKVAQVQLAEMATPTLALLCDGHYYDVASLETAWHKEADAGASFQRRIVSLGGAGLDALDQRLKTGGRPTEARLAAADMLLLAPCEPDRCAYLQLPPLDHSDERLRFERRDPHALRGHEHPLRLDPQRLQVAMPRIEAGLAVLLGDDLWQARRSEARRAVLGVTLLLGWGYSDSDWSEPRWPPQPGSHLGPAMLVGAEARMALERSLLLRWGERRCELGCLRDHVDAGERLAQLSQQVALRAGDVIGLGCFPGGGLDGGLAEAPRLSLARSMTLRATAFVPDPGWVAGGE